MDVKFYGINAAGREYPSYRTAPSVSEPARRQTAESAGSYDQLTLRQSYPADAGQFARILAREAAKDISVPASQARVDELRSQVAAGTYQPDAGQIARRMLCYS
ncbi:MAG: flagellar biosynthesis anti-sigma factor FlgM [Lachnospiraceae bacterium]|nr:flagellar biosynthesis anti-sigma factor FlgM [Lachnospiraceae bacterium]